jgi:hypothetical protein
MKFAVDIIGRLWRASRACGLVIGLVCVLVAFRLTLPFAVEKYVNRQLNRARDFGGRIGSIHIQLWRGRYRIAKVEIFKRTGGIHVPLFAADQLHLSIEWNELFHGSLVGQVLMVRPRLNFVAGPTPDQTQTGKEENWNTMLESLFPFNLNRLEIINGQVHFQNEHSMPPVDIYLNALSATATNLTNSRKVNSELPAGITAHATSIGGGGLDLKLQLNPLASVPAYQCNVQITNVDLVALNSFLRAYGKFDVERGGFALYTSIASKDGNYDGYVKVFFSKLEVFAWEKERKKNALEIFWQAIVGTLTTAFKNQSKDSLATRIPISGFYMKEKIGTWTAVATLLRHAFIKSLVPQVDEQITVQNVEQKIDDQQKLVDSPPPKKGAQQLARPGG